MGNDPSRIFRSEDPDAPRKVDYDNVHVRRILKAKEEMTGMDRVRMIFSKNEFGEIAPELQRCIDATLISMFVGAGLGGIGRSRIAYMDFFRQNTHTAFETPLQAKRVLQDKVVLGMGSGAFRIGWRLSAFTCMYMTSATAIAAYRGKVGIVDQVGGAGIAGFLYKFRDGPKAAVSGTVFGCMLGLVAGSMTCLAMKLFGMNMESGNLYYYHRLAMQQEKKREQMLNLRESTGTDSNRLTKFHEKLFGATQCEEKDNNTDVVPVVSAVAPIEGPISSKNSPNNSIPVQENSLKQMT